MEIIYEKYSLIVGFLVICLAVQTLLGSEALESMLLLVLISMVLVNADDFIKLIGGI